MPALPATPIFASDEPRTPVRRVRPMARSRVLLVNLLIAAIVLGQLYDTAADGDHWPFSSYPMFAQPREPLIRVKRLYGVTGDGEVALVVPRHLAPFHEARVMTAFKRIGRRPDRDQRLHAALEGVLARYDELRAAGEHDGPALDGVRLYVVTWPFDPTAANRDQPFERRLLGEALR